MCKLHKHSNVLRVVVFFQGGYFSKFVCKYKDLYYTAINGDSTKDAHSRLLFTKITHVF